MTANIRLSLSVTKCARRCSDRPLQLERILFQLRLLCENRHRLVTSVLAFNIHTSDTTFDTPLASWNSQKGQENSHGNFMQYPGKAGEVGYLGTLKYVYTLNK